MLTRKGFSLTTATHKNFMRVEVNCRLSANIRALNVPYTNLPYAALVTFFIECCAVVSYDQIKFSSVIFSPLPIYQLRMEINLNIHGKRDIINLCVAFLK